MIASPGSSSSARLVMALVFGVFFLAGCAFFFWLFVHPLLQSRQARDWRETPCRIISSGVKVSRSHNGATYSVAVAYAYEAAGKLCQSDRYQFLKFSSSGRASKEAVVARYRKGSRAVCYVNPRDPRDAVLDRSAVAAGLWGLFPLFFVAFGAFGIVAAIRGKAGGASVMNPDEPWSQRADWVAGRIVSDQAGLVPLGFFTVLWNAITFPVAWNVLHDQPLTHAHYGQGFVLLFPLVGLGLIIGLARAVMRQARFGRSIFEMAAIPGAVGGILKGNIRLSRPIFPLKPVKLCLECMERSLQRSSDGNSMREFPRWDDEVDLPLEPGSMEIPVAIRIPADASPTTTVNRGVGVFWRLRATAAVPGIDYKAQWEVPVYAVELFPEELAN